MHQLDELLNRNSQPKLTSPEPNDVHYDLIMQSAMRAPDHANLKPWRFLKFSGDSRKTLGNYILKSVQKNTVLDEQSIIKYSNMPLRAPCVLLAYCQHQVHDKVPLIEQKLATGAAITNILHASYQLGYGAIWRTGSIIYNTELHKQLKLTQQDHMIGFVYIGTIKEKTIKPTTPHWRTVTKDFVDE